MYRVVPDSVMTQFDEIHDLCTDLDLETETAQSPLDGTDSEFEIIIDFDSGGLPPEEAIEKVESEFDFSMYDASVAQADHTMDGEYALAVAGSS